MHILSADTSQGICSVSISNNQSLLAYREEQRTSKQAEMLVPMIESCLKEAQISYDDIALLTSTIGPGSFTGLRIGISTLQAIALVKSIPTYGVSTLQAIASTQHNTSTPLITSIIDARREQYYIQSFNHTNLTPYDTPTLIHTSALNTYLSALTFDTSIVTNLDALTTSTHSVNVNIAPNAQNATFIAHLFFSPSQQSTPLTPLYIREPDAKRPTPPAHLCN